MDPISIGLGVVGLGMNLFGGASSAGESARQAELSRQVGENEKQINKQKHDAFLLATRRQQLENTRNTQRARAMGLNAAVNQGAQFGSGLAGGQAQATAQGAANSTNISQNAIISDWISSYNDTISGLNAQISDSKGRQATDQGIASLGSSLMGGAKTFGSLTSGFGGFSLGSFGSGNYSGTPGASNTGGLY